MQRGIGERLEGLDTASTPAYNSGAFLVYSGRRRRETAISMAGTILLHSLHYTVSTTRFTAICEHAVLPMLAITNL